MKKRISATIDEKTERIIKEILGKAILETSLMLLRKQLNFLRRS